MKYAIERKEEEVEGLQSEIQHKGNKIEHIENALI